MYVAWLFAYPLGTEIKIGHSRGMWGCFFIPDLNMHTLRLPLVIGSPRTHDNIRFEQPQRCW